jgi:hypothetical protein
MVNANFREFYFETVRKALIGSKLVACQVLETAQRSSISERFALPKTHHNCPLTTFQTVSRLTSVNKGSSLGSFSLRIRYISPLPRR